MRIFPMNYSLRENFVRICTKDIWEKKKKIKCGAGGGGKRGGEEGGERKSNH